MAAANGGGPGGERHRGGSVCSVRRVFLPEEVRIYTDGRGGGEQTELAHLEVTVRPCAAPDGFG